MKLLIDSIPAYACTLCRKPLTDHTPGCARASVGKAVQVADDNVCKHGHHECDPCNYGEVGPWTADVAPATPDPDWVATGEPAIHVRKFDDAGEEVPGGEYVPAWSPELTDTTPDGWEKYPTGYFGRGDWLVWHPGPNWKCEGPYSKTQQIQLEFAKRESAITYAEGQLLTEARKHWSKVHTYDRWECATGPDDAIRWWCIAKISGRWLMRGPDMASGDHETELASFEHANAAIESTGGQS